MIFMVIYRLDSRKILFTNYTFSNIGLYEKRIAIKSSHIDIFLIIREVYFCVYITIVREKEKQCKW